MWRVSRTMRRPRQFARRPAAPERRAAPRAGAGDPGLGRDRSRLDRPEPVEINLFRLINQLPDPAGGPRGHHAVGCTCRGPGRCGGVRLGPATRLGMVVLAGLSAWLMRRCSIRSSRSALPTRASRGAAPRRGDTGALVSLDARCGRGRDGNGREPVPQPLGAPHDVVARVIDRGRAHLRRCAFPCRRHRRLRVGWVVGSAIHLVFGAPEGFPTRRSSPRASGSTASTSTASRRWTASAARFV